MKQEQQADQNQSQHVRWRPHGSSQTLPSAKLERWCLWRIVQLESTMQSVMRLKPLGPPEGQVLH